MKIREVSELTGLTQKTIRLYEQKGLISPGSVDKNGRAFREYSAYDVDRLIMIAGLRKAFFSIEQIKMMTAAPDTIPEVLHAYREAVDENYQRLSGLRDVVHAIDPDGVRDVYQLSHALESATHSLALPKADVTPHFRHLDEQYGMRPVQEARPKLFTKAYGLFISVTLMITALVLLSSYYGSRVVSFSDKRYQLVSYPSDFSADTHVYRFHADDHSDIGMRDILVEQMRSEYGRPNRKGLEAYCTYQITAVRSNGESLFLKYIPESATESINYDRTGNALRFPRFRVERQDGSVERINKDTTAPYLGLRGKASEDVILVADCIRVISRFVPFYKTALVTVIIAVSIFFLSAGMKLVILPNLLWQTSTDPKKRLTGHGIAGTLGMIPVIENNKQFIDDD